MGKIIRYKGKTYKQLLPGEISEEEVLKLVKEGKAMIRDEHGHLVQIHLKNK